MPQKQVKAKKGKSPKVVAPPPKKVQEESSEEDSDDSSEEEIVKKPVTKVTPAKNGKAKAQEPESDSDDSDDSDEVPAKPVAAKKAESDEDSSEEESEDEKPAPKSAKVTPAKKAPAKKEESSEEDSDDDSEDEVPAPKSAKKTPAKKEESSEEEDSDEEESEEEKPAPKAKKATPAKMEVDEEESDDEEGSDDEEDSDDEEESEEDEAPKKKRKAKGDKAEPSAKKAKVEDEVTLFVANLPEGLDEKKLKKFFEKKDIQVAAMRYNNKRRMCHVDLVNPSDLEAAVALNGETLKGSELKIEQARSRDAPTVKTPAKDTPKAFGADDDKGTTMFVKNLSFETTEEDLQGHFPGSVAIRMPVRPDGGIKGFAFVEFGSSEEVKSAIADKQNSELCGRTLTLDFTGAKSSFTPNRGGDRGGRGGFGGGDRQSSAELAGKTKTLFVKNLSWDTNNDSLQEAFQGCNSARVAMDRETGRSKGFGFIDFDSGEAAKEAFAAMTGQQIDGRDVTLDYAAEKAPGGFGGGRGGGGGGFRGGRGGFGDRGGRGGFRGGRGGFGDRGGRGGRGGGRGGGFKKDGIHEFKGSKKTFD